MNIYHDIECDLHEQVMMVADTAFEIIARTRAVLQNVDEIRSACLDEGGTPE